VLPAFRKVRHYRYWIQLFLKNHKLFPVKRNCWHRVRLPCVKHIAEKEIEEEDSAIGLASTLVEHREKAPIYYLLLFMISRQLKQSDSKRDFGLGVKTHTLDQE
jgi:hypothetical protein